MMIVRLYAALQAQLFDEIDAENRKGTVLVQGLNDEVRGLATHPTVRACM
jgi:hypothetical protein